MRKIIAYFREFYKHNRWLLLLYLLLTILHKTLAFISPIALQRLIDALVAGNYGDFLQALWIKIGLTAAFILALVFRSYAEQIAETNAAAISNERVLKDMLFMPFVKLRQNGVGHFIHLLERDVDHVRGLAFYDFVTLASNILLTIAMLVYLLRVDRPLSFIILAIIFLLVLTTKLMLPRLGKAESVILNEAEQLNDITDECYSGGETLRAGNAEGFFIGRIRKIVERLAAAQKKRAKIEIFYDYLLITGMMNLANTLIYCIGGLRVFYSAMTIGAITTFAMYFSSLWGYVDGFMAFAKEYKLKKISLDRLTELHEQNGEAKRIGLGTLPPFETLDVRGLGCSYDQKKVLNDLSFTLHRGDRMLILGENGSGKSTLARVLCKLLTPTSGQLLYNGLDYKDLDEALLRSRVLLIPADAFIIEGSWVDNLLGARPSVEAPKGLGDIAIEKKGGNLSSGQRKQLQLLRCLSSDADVIILDEPFNLVDQRLEGAPVEGDPANLRRKDPRRDFARLHAQGRLQPPAAAVIAKDPPRRRNHSRRGNFLWFHFVGLHLRQLPRPIPHDGFIIHRHGLRQRGTERANGRDGVPTVRRREAKLRRAARGERDLPRGFVHPRAVVKVRRGRFVKPELHAFQRGARAVRRGRRAELAGRVRHELRRFRLEALARAAPHGAPHVPRQIAHVLRHGDAPAAQKHDLVAQRAQAFAACLRVQRDHKPPAALARAGDVQKSVALRERRLLCAVRQLHRQRPPPRPRWKAPSSRPAPARAARAPRR